MAKTITRDIERRSDDRQAQIVVRMSAEQRAALNAAAQREGATVTGLVLDALAPYLSGAGRRTA